ncbi:uncharacterized protein LOC122250858 [Penaeus japonicus]|uniref:uncharacterized protein LOC122250858 n=1 Tax=Penaeus japonicus TaxID=27405 RepID=UPI001C716BA6|nr:uncharacterized protein LOC122250858 [Penaeus japonicus]
MDSLSGKTWFTVLDSRVAYWVFSDLLLMVGGLIMKKDTKFREAISASLRLTVILRFLASGDSFTSFMLKDRPKTAFTDGNQLYQYRRLSFWLSMAPTTFPRNMDVVLSSVRGRYTLAYLDDMVVSTSFDVHLTRLQETPGFLEYEGMELASFHDRKRHIPRFATITRPLTQLTKKNTKFEWGDAAQWSLPGYSSSEG